MAPSVIGRNVKNELSTTMSPNRVNHNPKHIVIGLIDCIAFVNEHKWDLSGFYLTGLTLPN
jgi:hypothetical protein